MWRLLIGILLLGIINPVLAQKRNKPMVKKTVVNKTVPPCNLTLKDAPKLRGFYLGQSYEEISEAIPKFEKAYREADNSYDDTPNVDYRVIHWSNISYPDTIKGYEDVLLTWQFYNSKLVRLYVTYLSFEPPTIQDFIKQASEKTFLPMQSFKISDKHKAVLVCNGFSANLYIGNESRVGWTEGPPEIMVEDTNAYLEMDRLSSEYKRKKKEEDLRKKREDQEKKKIFKP